MTEPTPTNNSPRWSAITKLSISLTIIVILGALIVRFKNLLGPVLFAFVVAYVLHPVISFLTRKTSISWKLAVSLVYLVFIAVLITLLTLSGVGIVQQVQNLIVTIQQYVDQLPEFIDQVSKWKLTIGPFVLDFAGFDWEMIGNQVLSYVKPALGNIGSLVGSLATGAAETVGWMIFIIIVSYFFLFESGGLRDRIIQVNIPVFADDIRQMGAKLSNIWNAFLRGQIIIFFLTAIVYAIFLTILGVRYALVLALITGFANFIPYIGPAINWVVLGLVTFFQTSNLFGISSFAYMAIVIVGAILIDQVFNNLINPRVMASALKVHPAFVLIAALVAANLIGVIGVIIAAPLLATAQLMGTYIVRKMLDQDPWTGKEHILPPREVFPAWVKKTFYRKRKAVKGTPRPARKKSRWLKFFTWLFSREKASRGRDKGLRK